MKMLRCGFMFPLASELIIPPPGSRKLLHWLQQQTHQQGSWQIDSIPKK
jgi:hypothetical protein